MFDSSRTVDDILAGSTKDLETALFHLRSEQVRRKNGNPIARFNYRVVMELAEDTCCFTIRDASYCGHSTEGKPCSISEAPHYPRGCSLHELHEELEKMFQALEAKVVIRDEYHEPVDGECGVIHPEPAFHKGDCEKSRYVLPPEKSQP